MTNIWNILLLLILPAVIAKVVIDDDGTERNTNVVEISNDLKASSVQPANATISSSPANKYKLYYFDFRGRGELVRLLLHYVGEPFEDFRVPRADWIPVYKKKTPYGHIPVLEVKETGQSLAESYAICRYIARKHGLAGKDDWEQAKVDEFADFHKDVQSKFHDFIFPADKAKSPEMASGAMKVAEELFPYYERQLNTSADSGLLFPSITWADFAVADFFETIQQAYPIMWAGFPKLEDYRNKVHSLPQLSGYLHQRTVTPN